jgi:hypothetical protein
MVSMTGQYLSATTHCKFHYTPVWDFSYALSDTILTKVFAPILNITAIF